MKKEYIMPSDFGLGSKLHESVHMGNPFLGALYALMSTDWKKDTVIFLGDEITANESNVNPAIRKLFIQHLEWGETGFNSDYVTENYKNISGYFKAAEKEVREDIQSMIENEAFETNYYRIDPKTPFEGLFTRELAFLRYTINHTKAEFFDSECKKVIEDNKQAVPKFQINPLPLLLAFGRKAVGVFDGLWLGDNIEVSNELPPRTYTNMSEKYIKDYWAV